MSAVWWHGFIAGAFIGACAGAFLMAIFVTGGTHHEDED